MATKARRFSTTQQRPHTSNSGDADVLGLQGGGLGTLLLQDVDVSGPLHKPAGLLPDGKALVHPLLVHKLFKKKEELGKWMWSMVWICHGLRATDLNRVNMNVLTIIQPYEFIL